MPVSFPPLTPPNPKVLILGSMPGEASLTANQYYAHPQNRFWKIMFRYFDAPFSNEYEIRKNLMLFNGIALWDTIEVCERENSSLDSSIKSPIPNDVAGFVRRNPCLQAIFTNGGKAAAMYKERFMQIMQRLPHRALPSTSPANARIGFEKLYCVWGTALDEFLFR